MARPTLIPEGFRWCKPCAKLKALSSFPLRPKESKGRGYTCNACWYKRQAIKEWVKAQYSQNERLYFYKKAERAEEIRKASKSYLTRIGLA